MTTFTDGLDGVAGTLLSARVGWALGTTANNADGLLATGGSGYRLATAVGDLQIVETTSQPATANQYAAAVLTNINAGSYPLGVRIQYGTTFGGYFVRRSSSTSTGLLLSRRSTSALTSTSYTTLGSGDGTNGSAPIRLVASGNQIWVEQGGVILIGPVTDTNFPTGKVGMHPRGTAGSGSAQHVDNWASGDLTATSYTLTAAPAALTLTGVPAALSVSRRLVAAAAPFAIAASGAALRIDRRLPAAAATVSLTGNAASLRASRRIPAGLAQIICGTAPANLRVSRVLPAEAAALSISASDAQLRVTRTGGPVPADHILMAAAEPRILDALADARVWVAAADPRILTA